MYTKSILVFVVLREDEPSLAQYRRSHSQEKTKTRLYKTKKYTTAKGGSRAQTDDTSGGTEKVYTVTAESELLTFLQEQMMEKGRNKVKAILARGQVRVGGKVVTRHDHHLKSGQTVRVNLFHPLSTRGLRGVRIVYEDAHLLVVEKAAGLLSIATEEEKQHTAYRQLQDYLEQGAMPQRVFIVHRLDRDTSGLMMFAKSEAVQQTLQHGWKEYVSDRVYTVLVEGHVTQEQAVIKSWLKETKTMQVYSSHIPGDGDEAITHITRLRAGEQYTLLEARLETGRRNQIRVHMKDLGHPVVGDKRYGATGNPMRRLGLHARVLAFRHPVTNQDMQFETVIPAAFNRLVNSESEVGDAAPAHVGAAHTHATKTRGSGAPTRRRAGRSS